MKFFHPQFRRATDAQALRRRLPLIVSLLLTLLIILSFANALRFFAQSFERIFASDSGTTTPTSGYNRAGWEELEVKWENLNIP